MILTAVKWAGIGGISMTVAVIALQAISAAQHNSFTVQENTSSLPVNLPLFSYPQTQQLQVFLCMTTRYFIF